MTSKPAMSEREPRRSRRLTVFGAALLTSGVGLAVLAPAAFAHHPLVDGSVTCATGEAQLIMWTVRNSETTTGTNRSMVITSATTTSGTVTGLVGQTVKPQPPAPATAPYAVGTTSLLGNQTGTVTLTVHGDWSAQGGPNDGVAQGSVTLPGNCVATTTTAPKTTTTTVPSTTTTVPQTTTTTVPSTTTTVPQTTTTTAPSGTTTTTVQQTTTTTAPSGTTTTTAPSGTTTNVAPSGTTTTTGPTSTTTAPANTTTTVAAQVLGAEVVPPASATPTPAVVSSDLPKTGSNARRYLQLAFGTLLAGAGVLLAVPRRRTSPR